MKHEKLRARLGAWGLAVSLLIGTLSGSGQEILPEQEVETPVQTTDFNQIFTEQQDPARNWGNPLHIEGNYMRLADGGHQQKVGADYISASAVISKQPISTSSDWEILADFTVDDFGFDCCNYGGYSITNGRTNEYYNFTTGYNGRALGLMVRTGFTKDPIVAMGDKKYGYGQKRLYLRYRAQDRMFYFSISDLRDVDENGYPDAQKTPDRGGSYFELSFANPIPSGDDLYLGITAGVDSGQQDVRLDANKKVEATFIKASYLDYRPHFIETKLLDENGDPFPADAEIKEGDIVTVQARVKNNQQDGGAVLSHLMISDDSETYPTSGLDFDPENWDGTRQEVTVDGRVVDAVNITGGGIPFSCSPTETVITYRAMVKNPSGGAVTVGQMMVDDLFQSKRHSGAELIPPVELVAADPQKPLEEQGNAGTDYHFTRTPANENGWNREPVQVTFYPGDFDRFNVQEDGVPADTLKADKPQRVYPDETVGLAAAYQAQNSETKKVSNKVADTVKIDRTPPTLATAEDSALTLRDGLSGVWKLERSDPDSGTWGAVQTYDLNDGNGAASQAATTDQNGKYRTVDAAGNVSTPLAVTVNSAPDVAPTDPADTLPPPEQQIDQNALAHAVVHNSMQEYLDAADPLYGGRFTAEDAQKLFEERYGFTSNVGRDDKLTYAYTISRDGVDVTAQGVDSTKAGSFTVTCGATAADGNTTTVVLADTLIDRDQPPTVAWGEDPEPPVGPPFDPLAPAPRPTVKDDPETGRKHAYVYDAITEPVKDPAVYGGRLTAETAAQILAGRYQIHTAQGDDVLVCGPVQVTVDGKEVGAGGFDTTRPGSCLIAQTVTDSRGNKTTIYLTYTLISSGGAPAVGYDPGSDTVQPDDKLADPEVITDWQSGNQYATVRDRLVQPVSDPPLYGGSLDLAGVRALIGGRYRFTSAQADGELREVRLTIESGGEPVTAIDTTRAGQYLITYTVEDSAGNRTTLFLQYILTPGGAGGLDPEEENGQPPAGESPYTGADGAGIDGSCRVHWLALLGALMTALYCLWARARRAAGSRPGWGGALVLSLLGAAAVSLWYTRCCALDAPLLWCWAALLAAGLGQFMAPGKEEQTD